MMGTMNRLAAAVLAALSFTACDGGIFDGDREFDFEPLEFPIAAPGDIERIAAFGTPNWSGTEPHNGTDLVVFRNRSQTRILSPTRGTVRSVTVSDNPYSTPPNQMMLAVEIFVNDAWTVTLVLEPGTAAAGTKNSQIGALRVQAGREVSPGDEIGELLVGELGYPHLHYMVQINNEPVCAYSHSSENARALFDGIAARSGSRICL